MTRTGRRPGRPRTKEAILAVARRLFASAGYDATSLRSIAAAAEVDPALLIHYFGTKERLFVEAMHLPEQLPQAFAALPADSLRGSIEALVRAFVAVTDSEGSRNAIVALVRSAVSNDKAAAMLREFFAAELLPHVARLTSEPDAALRAALVGAQLMGLAAARHVARLPPVAGASPDQIVRLVAPALEQYLVPESLR